jgi:hypothetical protein
MSAPLCLSLSDTQLRFVMDNAKLLPHRLRAVFLRDIGDLLRVHADMCSGIYGNDGFHDGAVFDAAMLALQSFGVTAAPGGTA